jgi:hypothetical protein
MVVSASAVLEPSTANAAAMSQRFIVFLPIKLLNAEEGSYPPFPFMSYVHH